jgi:hypothetical protein
MSQFGWMLYGLWIGACIAGAGCTWLIVRAAQQ